METSTEALPTIQFDAAARSVLAYLVDHVPMESWSIIRMENGRQTYLYLGESSYGLMQAALHPPDDSACTASIFEADGSLFGVICGVQSPTQPNAALTMAEPLVALLGQMLTAVLHADRTSERERQRAVAAELAAETDALTGLYNRRAWERLLADEVHRVDRHGDPTIVVMTDLDDLKMINDSGGHAAGDAYLRSAAAALLDAVRRTDVVARVGGDEFGVLLRHCDEGAADARIEEIHRSMGDVGVATSVGWAPVTIGDNLDAALAEADEALYVEKRARRARRTDPGLRPSIN
jgi:diguanylate cyclase (GGDEF)-like protein